MAINYAEKYEPKVLEVLLQNALTSPFVTTKFNFNGHKTVHITSNTTSGYKNHNLAGGFNRGTWDQNDIDFTIDHDRDIEFYVDKEVVDETNQTASIWNISSNFEQVHAAPEVDKLFFQRVCQAANKNGLLTSTDATTITKDNVLTYIKKNLTKGKLRRYKQRQSLLAYLPSELMDALEMSTEVTKSINIQKINISEQVGGIETRVAFVDNVPLIEIIDDERFYDSFNFDDGAVPAEGSHKINMLVACLETCFTVKKVTSIYFFAPGQHTGGDGYLYQNRSKFDTFVKPNGLNNKVDSIFVDVDTATYTEEEVQG